MPVVAEDLTGKRFDMLEVIERRGSSRGGHAQWRCRCDCGAECVVQGRYLRAKNDVQKNCGCISKKNTQEPSLSLDILHRNKDDPYRNLASAIVAVAADDYRIALRDDDKKMQKEIERFFESGWYKQLTTIKPGILLNMLRQEFQQRTVES